MGAAQLITARGRSLLERARSPGSPLASVLRLGSATAFGQIITVLTTPLLTRLYSPGDMGKFGLFQSFLSLAVVGICLRYEMGIVSAATDDEASDLLTLSFACALPLSLIAGMLLWLTIRFDIGSFGLIPLWSIPVMVAACVGAGAFVALRFWFARHGDFRTVGRAMMEQGVARAALPLVAAMGHVGWAGLLAGEVGGRVFGLTSLWRRAVRPVGSYVPRLDPRLLLATAKRNWRYPGIVLPSSLVDALSSAITVPIVAFAFGAAAAGEVFLAQRIVTLPSAFLAASVADVAHSRLSAERRNSAERLTPSVIRIGTALAAVGVLIYLPVALIAPWGAPLAFGAQWRTTGWIVSLLSPLAVTSLVANPLSRVFVVVDRPELKLGGDIALVAAPILALIATQVYGLGILAWTGLFALFSVIATLTAVGLAAYAAHHPAQRHE